MRPTSLSTSGPVALHGHLGAVAPHGNLNSSASDRVVLAVASPSLAAWMRLPGGNMACLPIHLGTGGPPWPPRGAAPHGDLDGSALDRVVLTAAPPSPTARMGLLGGDAAHLPIHLRDGGPPWPPRDGGAPWRPRWQCAMVDPPPSPASAVELASSEPDPAPPRAITMEGTLCVSTHAHGRPSPSSPTMVASFPTVAMVARSGSSFSSFLVLHPSR